MQFASSASTEAPATHNYFGAAINVDESKITQLPRAGPSRQPITSIKITKIPGLLSPMKIHESKVASGCTEYNRFRTPGGFFDREGADNWSASPPKISIQLASRSTRSVAPSPAPMPPQIHEVIKHLYALESEQAEEIRALTKEILAEAFKICLSTPGSVVGRYHQRIAELLGEGVERRVVDDAEELKETGRLPVLTPSRDAGYLGIRTTYPNANVVTPARLSMPRPSFISSRKRLREADSDEEIREVESSLLLSGNASVSTISSRVDSPASKRPRLESWVPTIGEDMDNAMLGIICCRYFNTPEEADGSEYSPDDERVDDDDESDSSSDMEVEEEDFSLAALTQGLPDELVGFTEEAALYEADGPAEEASMNQSPNPPPNVDSCFIHPFGTAADRLPVPAPRPIPQAPRRLHRSNERVTVNEDGSVEVFDYTQTNEYAERVAWERHMFVIHGQSGFDNRGGPCDLAADLREITQVGPGGELLDCYRWQYRFDEQAWRYFEVPS
ncbi:hypothetical protein NLJ89_g5329 [Agrocybe chaxingu]|uniref:Uncharacterized protein n=1 Tax=Agrocybe chaxingu TaxID=84603 RepID=A0A9W8MTP8_9AGAR|nr:hypothetical protein NLJ89_g5329 [Agrocybe chaxingu]